MNEKQMELVEQYEVEVKNSYRSRGCLHLETDRGLLCVVPYHGSPLRLACELELQKMLYAEGFTNVDLIIPNKEEGLISYDKYRTPFIVKQSFEGRECSLKEEQDLERACRNLGALHKTLAGFQEYQVDKRKTPSIAEQLNARKLELRRIRNYVKKSGRRTEFELTFTACYENFYEEAEAAAALALSEEEAIGKQGYGICHGAYHQHNILMLKEGEATLNLGQFHYNQQILDLYNLMRKALEKNHYQSRIFEHGLEGYEKEIRLTEADYKNLKILFSFPEKFWKISNQYYNSKKCWMPPKNLEKLKKAIEQNEYRRKFVKELA